MSISKKILILLGISVFVSIATLVIVRTTIANNPTESENTKINVDKDQSTFTLNSAQAPNWQSNGNNRPKLEDFTGGQMMQDDIEKVSTTISQKQTDKSSPCTVSFYYWEKPLKETALEDFKKFTIGSSKTLLLEERNTATVEVKLPAGRQTLTLYQYNLTGSNSSSVSRGVEFGFLQLPRGYLEVRGYCATYEMLATTISAINAMSLKP